MKKIFISLLAFSTLVACQTAKPLVWEKMNFYPLEGISPCINVDGLYYYDDSQKDPSLDPAVCPWMSPSYPAGDEPQPISLYDELYQDLPSEDARVEAQNAQDPSFKVEWGPIEDHQNSHGISYQTQTYRYESDSIISGVQIGTWVSIIKSPYGPKFLFDIADGYEDQIEPFTEQFQ